MHVVALSGSLRSGSSNSRLLRAAAKMAANWADFIFYDRQIAELPHFSPDLDSEGSVAPPAVAELRRVLASADAVLVCCPEYAHGVPGSFKNALDWIVSSGELTDKPVALIMASASGAEQARAALVLTLRVIGANLVFDCSLVLAPTYVAADGSISEERTAEVVRDALAALLRETAREKHDALDSEHTK